MAPPEYEQREEQQGEAAVYEGIDATNTQSVENTQGRAIFLLQILIFAAFICPRVLIHNNLIKSRCPLIQNRLKYGLPLMHSKYVTPKYASLT